MYYIFQFFNCSIYLYSCSIFILFICLSDFLSVAFMIFSLFQVPNSCIKHGGHRMWYMLQNFCNKTILGFAQINSYGREKFWMYCLSEKETLLIIYLYRKARNICIILWYRDVKIRVNVLTTKNSGQEIQNYVVCKIDGFLKTVWNECT